MTGPQGLFNAEGRPIMEHGPNPKTFDDACWWINTLWNWMVDDKKDLTMAHHKIEIALCPSWRIFKRRKLRASYESTMAAMNRED